MPLFVFTAKLIYFICSGMNCFKSLQNNKYRKLNDDYSVVVYV